MRTSMLDQLAETEVDIQGMADWSHTIIEFGNHRGWTYGDLYKNQPGYCNWVMQAARSVEGEPNVDDQTKSDMCDLAHFLEKVTKLNAQYDQAVQCGFAQVRSQIPLWTATSSAPKTAMRSMVPPQTMMPAQRAMPVPLAQPVVLGPGGPTPPKPMDVESDTAAQEDEITKSLEQQFMGGAVVVDGHSLSPEPAEKFGANRTTEEELFGEPDPERSAVINNLEDLQNLVQEPLMDAPGISEDSTQSSPKFRLPVRPRERNGYLMQTPPIPERERSSSRSRT